MRPSYLGGGRILRRTLSVCLSVCPSVPLSSVTWRHLANYNDTHVLFGRGPHIVRPSRPHKFLFIGNISYAVTFCRANKDVYIIYCLLFTYSALSVTYLPPRGATVHALNRKSVKNKEFPVPLYWVSLTKLYERYPISKFSDSDSPILAPKAVIL